MHNFIYMILKMDYMIKNQDQFSNIPKFSDVKPIPFTFKEKIKNFFKWEYIPRKYTNESFELFGSTYEMRSACEKYIGYSILDDQSHTFIFIHDDNTLEMYNSFYFDPIINDSFYELHIDIAIKIYPFSSQNLKFSITINHIMMFDDISNNTVIEDFLREFYDMELENQIGELNESDILLLNLIR